MFQLHYDNPQREAGVQVDVRVDFFYTDRLRPNEGGFMAVTPDIPGLPENLLIPPQSQGHRILAHCSPECTRRMYSENQGITVSTVALHGHNAAVGMRLRQFRGARELPWISYDDNYDNTYQNLRHLNQEVRILPGDQLTVDCTYRTNGSSTVGGFTTRHEMCMAFMVYYNKIKDYSFCFSSIQSPEGRARFLAGTQNITWVQENILEWIVQSPQNLAGMRVTEVSDRVVDWNQQRRQELQRFHLEEMQWGGCHRDIYARSLAALAMLSMNPQPIGEPPGGPLNTPDDYRGLIGYPWAAEVYRPPPRVCNAPERPQGSLAGKIGSWGNVGGTGGFWKWG